MSNIKDVCDHCGDQKLVEAKTPALRTLMTPKAYRFARENNQLDGAALRVFCKHCYTMYHEDSLL